MNTKLVSMTHSMPATLTQSLRSGSLRVHGLMLLASGLIATSFPVGAEITGGLDAVVLTFLRFALATALFAPLVAWKVGLVLPGPKDLLRYGALGACLATFFWCMFEALRSTSALNTAAIFALMPVITALFAALLLRERLALLSRIALPIGSVGAIWVVFRGDMQALLSLDLGGGDLLFLAGTVSLAAYSTLVKLLHRGEPMARLTFWTMAAGTVWLLLLALPRLPAIEWAEVPMTVYAGIGYLAVFTTIITFFVFQWSTSIIGPTRVSAYTFLNPALVLALGIALGDGLPPAATWPGIALVILATLTLQGQTGQGPKGALEKLR
ncbi:MAG: DMT family transporter [Rhodospirillaceae bacterium]